MAFKRPVALSGARPLHALAQLTNFYFLFSTSIPTSRPGDDAVGQGVAPGMTRWGERDDVVDDVDDVDDDENGGEDEKRRTRPEKIYLFSM